MLPSVLKSWRVPTLQVPIKAFVDGLQLVSKDNVLSHIQRCLTTDLQAGAIPSSRPVSVQPTSDVNLRGPEYVYFWEKLKKCFGLGSKKGGKGKGKKTKKQECKSSKGKCSKQKDTCLKKKESDKCGAKPPEKAKPDCKPKENKKSSKPADPCKKSDPPKKKEEPCKKEVKKAEPSKKKEDPCKKEDKKKEDPCKKKEDPCKKKEDPCKKKEDPCKKKEDPCKTKEDPCKKKEDKKEDPCKKKEDKKEDPCKKKEDPCKKKEDPCKMKEDPCKKKEDPCKKKEDPCKKKEDPCKKKEDPCKKKEDPCKKKEDPCKKKEDPCKKKEDPCKKKEDPCQKKEDPCKKKEDPCKKKEDPCKKKEDPCQKKEDPCKKKEDPCKKKEDPCKKKEDPCEKKEDPCKKKEDPCKKKEDPCQKKEDPCKKKEDPCKKKEDPCEKKEDPCKKKDPCGDKFISNESLASDPILLFSMSHPARKKEEEIRGSCKDPCAQGACDVLPGQDEPCGSSVSWKVKVNPCRQRSSSSSKTKCSKPTACIVDSKKKEEEKLEKDSDDCGLVAHPCGKKLCPNRCEIKKKREFSSTEESFEFGILNFMNVLAGQAVDILSLAVNFASQRGSPVDRNPPSRNQPGIPASAPGSVAQKVTGVISKIKGFWNGPQDSNLPIEKQQSRPTNVPTNTPGRSTGRHPMRQRYEGLETNSRGDFSISEDSKQSALPTESGLVFAAGQDDFEKCEDRTPPCPIEIETMPCPKKTETCEKTTDEIWSDIDDSYGYEKFPFKQEATKGQPLEVVSLSPDDPYSNHRL